jgi:hypothetical protein
MTNLQRNALKRPCRSIEDQQDVMHTAWLEVDDVIALAVVTVDIAGPGLSVPEGLGPAIWHVSLSYRRAFGALGPGSIPPGQPIRLKNLTPAMLDAADGHLHRFLDGVGGDLERRLRGKHALHLVRSLSAIEHRIVLGGGD